MLILLSFFDGSSLSLNTLMAGRSYESPSTKSPDKVLAPIPVSVVLLLFLIERHTSVDIGRADANATPQPRRGEASGGRTGAHVCGA